MGGISHVIYNQKPHQGGIDLEEKIMNRELKFRAWDDRTKMWLFSYNHPNLGGFSMKGEVMLFGEYQRFLERVPLEDWSKIILMQYTGLKDKNGKEIYEGDILHDNKHWVVKILDGGAWALDYANGSGEKYLYPINKHLCVIGNIYENPELLK